MGIETNANHDQPKGGHKTQDDKSNSSFSGTTMSSGAPSGSGDFVSLQSSFGISRVDSSVGPYLDDVVKLVKDNLSQNGVQLIRLPNLNGAYAIQYDAPDGATAFFGLQFVSVTDPINSQLFPASIRLKPLSETLRQKFEGKDIRMVDSRVIFGGLKLDMDKTFEMANTIVSAFQATCHPDQKNAKVDTITTNEFVADWSLNNARHAERRLSPHGVAPRMDVGLSVNARIQNNWGKEFREFDTDFKPYGVIGGYTEIRDREQFIDRDNRRVMLYQPVFNITVLNSEIPLEGVAATLIAAIAPTIYNSKFWAKQWQDMSDGHPNPGNLELDAKGKPYDLKNQEELLEFIDTYFAVPAIAFQLQDGRDAIPGMWRMTRPESNHKTHFVNRLADFFGVQAGDAANAELSRPVATRYDGAYGDPNGHLSDSRDVDYLSIAAKSGVGSITPDMRRVLLGGSENPTDLAQIVQHATNSFVPVWMTSQVVLNPDFIKWIIQQCDSKRLTITDPNSRNEARAFSSFISGFGSAQGIGSIITSGQTSRGLNLGSFWSNW